MEPNQGKQHQHGMTFAGMIIMLVLFASVVMIMIKIAPVYLENFKVTSALKSLAQDHDIHAQTPQAIRETLLKRFDINDVDRFSAKDIEISYEGNKLVISIDYEARTPIFLNLDIVAKFPNNKVEIAKP